MPQFVARVTPGLLALSAPQCSSFATGFTFITYCVYKMYDMYRLKPGSEVAQDIPIYIFVA